MRPLGVAAVLGVIALLAGAAEGGREAPAPPGTIAFLSDRSPNRGGEVYSVRAMGGGRRSLSRGPLIADYAVTPSLNVRKLAFVSSRGGSWAVWVRATRTGARLTRIARLGREPIEPTIDWDPSGRRLVFDHGLAEGHRHEVWTTAPRRRIGRRAWRPDWSPTGSWIAFENYVGDDEESRVVVVSPRGDVLWRRPGYSPRWSQNGRLLAFTTPSSKVALATPTGRIVRRIGRAVEQFAWLPGGKHLVLQGNRIWIVTATGRVVLTLPASVQAVAPSADGTRVAYVARDDLVVAPLRGRPRRVARAIALPLDWSPDGRRILALRPLESPRLLAVRADGGGVQAIAAEPPGSVIRTALWDGNLRVIYESHGPRTADLYLRSSAGVERRLTRKFAYAFPQWAPDGASIAGSRPSMYESDIFVVDGSTGRGAQITQRPREEDLPFAESPTWSPDGKSIVFHRTGPPGFSIRVVSASGGRERVLFRFSTQGAWTRFPAWSPDGARLAFLTDEQVFVMNADGSAARSLGAAGSGPQSTTWSPDGRRVAWRVGNTIRVVAVDGTLPPSIAVRRSELLCGTRIESSPPGLAWSRDGNRFVFGGCGGSGSLRTSLDLWSVRTDGTRLTRLTTSVASDWSPTLR